MRERQIEFVRQVAAQSPGLTSLLEQHNKDNGEVLPHVFVGDLTEYLISLIPAISRGSESAQPLELHETLDRLEMGYSSGDEELRELIAASFLENLPQTGERGSQLRSMLGPSLSKKLRSMDSC